MKIDIDDVVSAGSVEAAIIEVVSNSDTVASGVIGPSFSCSRPGSGWQKNHDAADYAARALADDYGAVEYMDADDGRMATLDGDGDVVWSDESELEVVVPSEEDALRHPEALLAMAVSVRAYHAPASDAQGWSDLLAAIRAAAEKIEDVEIEVPSAK